MRPADELPAAIRLARQKITRATVALKKGDLARAALELELADLATEDVSRLYHLMTTDP